MFLLFWLNLCLFIPFKVEFRIVHDSIKGIWVKSSCDVKSRTTLKRFTVNYLHFWTVKAFCRKKSFDSGSIAINSTEILQRHPCHRIWRRALTQATQKSVLLLDTKWNPIRIYPVYNHRDNTKPRVSLALTKLLLMLTTNLRTKKDSEIPRGSKGRILKDR